jgi:hypothetical protein
MTPRWPVLLRRERSWRRFVGLGLLYVSIIVLAWLLWYGVLGQSDA